MVGSTVAEKVVERQYEEKLMTSRTSTPASAGRSRRRRRGSITRLLRVRPPAPAAMSNPSVPSSDLFPGQQYEHVLEVRGPAMAVRHVPVEAEDRDARARAPGGEAGGVRLGLDLGQPLRRSVDLHGLSSRVLLD